MSNKNALEKLSPTFSLLPPPPIFPYVKESKSKKHFYPKSLKGLFNSFIFSCCVLLFLPLGRGFAQNIAINTTGAAANASAILDVSATNLGMLIPRVALTASNSASPITSPAVSLLVYNTATAGAVPNNVTPGYYWWNGAKWKRFTDNDFLTFTQTATLYAFASTTLKSITVTTQAQDRVLLIGQWDFSKNATASWVASEIWRGATELAENSGFATASADGNAYCHWVDTPGAGTWTYNFRYSFGGGGFSFQYGSMFYAIILKQ